MEMLVFFVNFCDHCIILLLFCKQDSLQTWKERCSELEEQLEQGMISEVSGRRGSQEVCSLSIQTNA